jgi:hypothetical protein
MSSYLGDLILGSTIDFKFTTVTTTGAPTTLAGTPVVSAYPDNSTTQVPTGITLTVDFDGVTGLHNVRVVASSGNGYLTATNYDLVITTGTVGGTSVVGYVVGRFSIQNRPVYTLGTQAKADVNAEVLDVLNTDTFAEIGQEAPAATQTLRKMVAYLYKAWRNKVEQTATSYKLYNDAGSTVDQKATDSYDGTTYTAGEKATGP